MVPSSSNKRKFRTPLGFVIMGYKGLLGLSEITGGLALALPRFDPQSLFTRLSSRELREDPTDRLATFVSNHLLRAISVHRNGIAVALLALGIAKLAAVAGMWLGKEWGMWLLLAVVGAGLPFDANALIQNASLVRWGFAAANTAAFVVLATIVINRQRHPADKEET